MKHPSKNLRVLCAIAVSIWMTAVLFSLSACASVFSPLGGETSDAATPPNRTPGAPTMMQALPSPTPFFINPVQTFYNDYRTETAARYRTLVEALNAAQSADNAAFSLALTAHSVKLSEIITTAGRLFADETGAEGFVSSYSGSVFGANEGYGTMRVSSLPGNEVTLEFRFDYVDGNRLYGTLTGNALQFTVSAFALLNPDATPDADGIEPGEEWQETVLLRASIKKTDEGYVSSVLDEEHGENASLEIGVITRFVWGNRTVSYDGATLTEPTATPIIE